MNGARERPEHIVRTQQRVWKLRQPGVLSRLERNRRMFCHQTKDDRRVTTRYYKLTTGFRAAIHVAAAVNDCL